MNYSQGCISEIIWYWVGMLSEHDLMDFFDGQYAYY